MSDAYADWLGVPAAFRPPTYYQLLGIDPAELDPAVIAAAADRQLDKLRPHESGPHAAEARRLIQEVTDARRTLLDPVTRLRYDTMAPDAADPWWKPEATPEPVEVVRPVEGWWQGEVADAPPDPPPTPAAPPPAAKSNDWWQAPAAKAVAAPEILPEPPPPRPAWREYLDRRKAEPPPEPAPPPPAPPQAPVIPEDALLLPEQRKPTSAAPWVIAAAIVLVSVGAAVVIALKPWEREAPPDNPAPVADNRSGPIMPAGVAIPLGGDRASGRAIRQPPPMPFEVPPAKPPADPPKADPEPPAPSPPPKVEPKPPEPKAGPEPEPFREPVTLRGHKGSVYGIAVSRSGKTILSVSDDMTVLAHSPAAPDKPESLKKLMSQGVAVALCNDDKTALFCDGADVVVYDLAGRRVRTSFENPRGGLRCLTATADGSRIFTGTTDGCVRVWSESAGGLVQELDIDAKAKVSAVAIEPDAAHVAVGLSDGKVAVWDVKQRKELKRWPAHKKEVTAIAYSPDGKRLLSAGDDGVACVWSPAGTLVQKLAGHDGPVLGAAWCFDGTAVLTAGIDRKLKLWTEAGGWKAGWSADLPEKAYCLAIDPRDRFAVVGLSGGSVRLVPLPKPGLAPTP